MRLTTIIVSLQLVSHRLFTHGAIISPGSSRDHGISDRNQEGGGDTPVTSFVRGGSLVETLPPRNETEIQSSRVYKARTSPIKVEFTPEQATPQRIPVLDHRSLSLALRLTSEVNRRLAMRTDPTHSWSNDETSIFYTDPSKRPPLSSYIERVYTTFGYGNIPLIPALTLIYLDRACSLGTVREFPEEQSPHCPHLNQNNVHKLFLAANILAMRTYRDELPSVYGRGAFTDDITHQYLRMLQLSKGDVPQLIKEMTVTELGNLCEWVAASLGADGPAVSVEEVDTFIHNWKNLFEWENGFPSYS